MTPPDYSGFFSTMAAVSATLFGLIFVVISIVPASIAPDTAPLERQVKAFSAYNALLNALVISLYALLYAQSVPIVAIVFSTIGLIHTLVMLVFLLRHPVQMRARLQNSTFILSSLILYGFETYFAIRLMYAPTNNGYIFGLAQILIFLSIFGVIRSWELVGVRKFNLQELLFMLGESRKKENIPDASAADVKKRVD